MNFFFLLFTHTFWYIVRVDILLYSLFLMLFSAFSLASFLVNCGLSSWMAVAILRNRTRSVKMEVLSAFVKVSVANYFKSLPIPDTIGGFGNLSGQFNVWLSIWSCHCTLLVRYRIITYYHSYWQCFRRPEVLLFYSKPMNIFPSRKNTNIPKRVHTLVQNFTSKFLRNQNLYKKHICNLVLSTWWSQLSPN